MGRTRTALLGGLAAGALTAGVTAYAQADATRQPATRAPSVIVAGKVLEPRAPAPPSAGSATLRRIDPGARRTLCTSPGGEPLLLRDQRGHVLHGTLTPGEVYTLCLVPPPSGFRDPMAGDATPSPGSAPTPVMPDR